MPTAPATVSLASAIAHALATQFSNQIPLQHGVGLPASPNAFKTVVAGMPDDVTDLVPCAVVYATKDTSSHKTMNGLSPAGATIWDTQTFVIRSLIARDQNKITVGGVTWTVEEYNIQTIRDAILPYFMHYVQLQAAVPGLLKVTPTPAMAFGYVATLNGQVYRAHEFIIETLYTWTVTGGLQP